MSDWYNAEQHAERAHEFFQAGQWDKALAELKAALAVNPDQSEWHFGMGLTLDALQRYGEAVRSFEQVLRLRGDDLDTLLHLGVDLIRSGEDARAIEVFERAAKADPDCEAAYCFRIAAYTHLGDHDQAEQMFYLARQLVERCPLCYDHIAHSLAARGEWDRAIWCWQQVLEQEPHYPDAYLNLARLHWRKGQLERARQYYLQQLREDPGHLEALLQLGGVLVEMGRPAEAADKFRRAVELEPDCADAYLKLGMLALMGGHLDAAEADLEHAARLDPDRPGVQLRLAQAAQQRGDLTKARLHLEAELGLEGHEPALCLELAQMCIELRQPGPAVDLLTPLLREAGDAELDDNLRATAHVYRGVAAMLLGQCDRGIADCRRALHLDPRHLLAMHNLVLAYAHLGRYRRARYWLRRALQIQPDDTQLRQLRHRLAWASLVDGLRRWRQRWLARLIPGRSRRRRRR